MRTRIRLFVGLTIVLWTYAVFATGTGFWLGDMAGTPKFSIGNPSGNYMTWDGTTLSIVAVTPSTTITNTGDFNTDEKTGSIRWSGTLNSGWAHNQISGCTSGRQMSVVNTSAASTLNIYHHHGVPGGSGSFNTPGGTTMVLARGDSFTAECMTVGIYLEWFVLTKAIA